MSAMLVSLRIRNLALAEDVFWEPSPGFNTISGETGAGKSMILGALKLILGDRADRMTIRSGETSCTIEAEFQVDDPLHWNELLSERGAEPCQEGICLVRRIFTSHGTSRNFLNGSPCTLSLLKEVGKHLVDLHGPHDHQSLFSREEQSRLLDAFAGALEQRKQVAQIRQKILRLLEEQTRLAEDQQAIEREIDLLRHQTQEIFSAHLIPGEEEELLSQQQVASHAKRIGQIARELEEQLTEGERCMTSLLSEMLRKLREWLRWDARATILLKLHAEISEKIKECSSHIRNLSPEEEPDLASLAQMEERLDTLQSLKRKYGSSTSEILTFAKKSQAHLEELMNRESRKNNLRDLLQQEKENMERAAAKLSQQRQAAAPRLEEIVRRQLHELGFRQAEFSIQLHPLSEVSAGEKPEFFFAPHPGEPSLPLKSIASSGEISRILLALKTALVEEDQVPILVFDEIDSNIGGEIATMVGIKIKNIAAKKQVLCISHLPQVAASASTHFVVEKKVMEGRSHSVIREVRNKDRVEELARMLGGKAASAVVHAQSLLESTLP